MFGNIKGFSLLEVILSLLVEFSSRFIELNFCFIFVRFNTLPLQDVDSNPKKIKKNSRVKLIACSPTITEQTREETMSMAKYKHARQRWDRAP
jgi:hypothetical protein